MKKISTTLLTLLITFSLFTVFSYEAHAQDGFEQLTTNPYKDRNPSWHPDGTKIIYSAFSGTWYRHIWVMNADGSGKTQLTSGNVVQEQPAYSPDGLKIVFTQWGFRGDYSDIMIMDADGTNIQRLTFSGVSGLPDGTYNGVEWSQDGTKLIFMFIEGTTGTPWPVRKFWICTMDPDGTDLTVLGRGIWPKFVLGDTKILFNTELPELKIAIMNADGTDIQILTSGPVDHSPDMARSSHRIVFIRAPVFGELGDLYIMDSDGSDQIPLLDDGQNLEAYWSPDKTYIAYVSDKSGNYDIWKIKAPILWEYIFTDPCRETELRISTDDEYFQFVAPDKEFPITQADKMKFCGNSFYIYHRDENIRLVAVGNTKFDFCVALAEDLHTGQYYFLHDRIDWCSWRRARSSECMVR